MVPIAHLSVSSLAHSGEYELIASGCVGLQGERTSTLCCLAAAFSSSSFWRAASLSWRSRSLSGCCGAGPSTIPNTSLSAPARRLQGISQIQSLFQV